ncbi:MAG TPA: hypothetical protein VNF29_09820 [Candidatus Binataceae bacterium]|nr:hypothetical protein [Candidatus Binataceae bacterium]
MIVRVTFDKPDEVLAAVVRSLVAKAAGLHAVSGTNEGVLHQEGVYEFELNRRQYNKLKQWAAIYIAAEFAA